MNIKQLLDHCEQDSSDKLPQLLHMIANVKNEHFTYRAIHIIQKHSHTNKDQSAIIDFIAFARTEFDETINIKLISTMLHLIDSDWAYNCIKLLNLFLSFTQSDNSIIQQSAIQGIILVVSNISNDQLMELLEIFFQIQQDKCQSIIHTGYNLILCKDIFIMLLRKGKQMNHNDFYAHNLYKYLSQLDLPSGNALLSKINHIRLLFTYVHTMSDKLELLQSIMQMYSKLNMFDICKIAIHNGLLLLYSEKMIFQKIASESLNGFNSIAYDQLGYHEFFFKIIFSSTLQSLTEYGQAVVWKQNNQHVNLSAQYLEFTQQSASRQFISQITQLIQQTANNLITKECQVNEIQTWRPMLKMLRHLLSISSPSQFQEQNDQLIKWIKSSEHELLIRFLASISIPTNKEQNEKWIVSYKLLQQQIKNYNRLFSPKTWNCILQTLQRIELCNYQLEEITNFFTNSSEYDEETLQRMIDGLTQLALQISEKVQTSENTKDFDKLYKQFAVDKIVLIAQSNVHRIQIIWNSVEALLLCLCCSKIQEIRQSTLNCLKSILFICVDANCISINLLGPINELINSRFDDVVEYIMNLLYILIKEHHIQKDLQTDLIKIIESLLNEKEEFIHLLLCLNCLNELVFNQLDSLSDQCLMRLSSILVYTTKYLQKQYHNDIKNKIISMIWQLQLKLMQHKLVNPGLWNVSLKLLRETIDSLDELKFAALHIISQFCLNASTDQFNEAFEVFEELLNNSVQQHLKVEYQYICLITNTPRFHSNLIETPKFQVQSMKFDKQTIIEQYKQSLETFKLCITLWADIIISKEKYDKFYYYVQLFNQPQLVYAKHELVVALSKILQHSHSELKISLDIVSSLLDNEQMDITYFTENQTFQYVCQILKFGFQKNEQQSFLITQKLMALVCSDNFLSENSILKYFLQFCLAELVLEEQQILKWMVFLTEIFSPLGVQLRYHKLLEMICTAFEMIIKPKVTEPMIEHIVKFIKQLLIQLNKCQRFTNDNSEKLQIIFISKLRYLFAQVLAYLNEETLAQIVEPIMISSKRNKDWVSYFLQLSFNPCQEAIMVEIITSFYVNQIITRESISQQTTIINIISLFEQKNQIINRVLEAIKSTLFQSIYQNLQQYIDDSEKNNEKEFNMCIMLDFLLQQETTLNPILLKLIACEQIEVRIKLIELFKKFGI